MFSICIVCYNDLDFLKILYKSIKQNTKIKYEILIHDNASTDGTEEWLKENNINYSRSATNEGNPALNYAVQRAKYDYIALPNPDTYLLPGWDIALLKQINKFKQQQIEKFMISFCCVEPMGQNMEYQIYYCGHTPQTFDENKLLNYYLTEASKYVKIDTIQYSFPNCMPTKMWREFGGMDIEYWPGWTVDVDMAARAYRIGCRDFILMAHPRVYHFINGTYRKLSKEDNAKNGWDLFKSKWGMTVEEFRKRMKIAQPFEKLSEGILDV